MTIERLIEHERRRWSSLLEVDDGTPSVFEQLARRSARFDLLIFSSMGCCLGVHAIAEAAKDLSAFR